MRSTVAIPLHRSSAWLETVAGNISRLAGRARLIVSDASGEDDTLDRLRARFADVAGIDWVGPRPLPRGWVEHCNDLLVRADTEYFMWLPHDDDIDADWVVEGELMLDAFPDAVLACGHIVVERSEAAAGPPQARIDADPRLGVDDAVDRIAAAIDTMLWGDSSRLGIMFRALQRRALTAPLPSVDDRGSWTDLLWSVELAARGRFVTTSAAYRKRWHPANTHSQWTDLRHDPRLRAEHLLSLLSGLDPSTQRTVLATVWSNEAIALGVERDELRALNSRLEAAHLARTAEIDAEYRSSTSWRLTAPVRALGRLASRLSSRGRPDPGSSLVT